MADAQQTGYQWENINYDPEKKGDNPGGDTAIEVINHAQQLSARVRTQAETKLNLLLNENNTLLNSLDREINNLLQQNADFKWDVDDPTFDAQVLKNVKSPDDPELGEKLPVDVNIDPPQPEDWNVEGLGEFPPGPPIEFKPAETVPNPKPFEGLYPPTEPFLFEYKEYIKDTIDRLKSEALQYITNGYQGDSPANITLSTLNPNHSSRDFYVSAVDTTSVDYDVDYGLNLDNTVIESETCPPLELSNLTPDNSLDELGAVPPEAPDEVTFDVEGLPDVTDVHITIPDTINTSYEPINLDPIEIDISPIRNIQSYDYESEIAPDGNTGDIVPVDSARESAIYDRAEARLATSEANEIAVSEDAVQARGFSLPPGALSALRANIQNKYADARTDLNRDVLVSSIELEQKRTEYELQKAGQKTDAQAKRDATALDVDRLALDAEKTVATLEIERGKALAGIEADAGRLLLDGELANLQTRTEMAKIEIEDSKLQIEAERSEADVRVKALGAVTELKKAEAEVMVENSRMLTEFGKLEAETSKINADIKIAAANADIEFGKANAQINIEKNRNNLEYKKVDIDIKKTNVANAIDIAKTSADLKKVKAQLQIEAERLNLEYARVNADISKQNAAHAIELDRLDVDISKAGAEISAKEQEINLKYAQMELEREMHYVDKSIKYVDACTSLEQLLVGLHKQEQDMLFEVEKENFQSEWTAYSLKIEAAKSIMQGYQIEQAAEVSVMEANIEYNKALLTQFQEELHWRRQQFDEEKLKLDGKKLMSELEFQRINSEVAVIEGENSRLQNLAEVYKASVQAYATKMDGMKTAETLDLTRYEMEGKGRAAGVSAAVEVASLKIEAAVKKASLQIQTIQEQAKQSASAISASLNALGTTASFGFSGSLGKRWDWGGKSNISYSYSAGSPDSTAMKI